MLMEDLALDFDLARAQIYNSHLFQAICYTVVLNDPFFHESSRKKQPFLVIMR